MLGGQTGCAGRVDKQESVADGLAEEEEEEELNAMNKWGRLWTGFTSSVFNLNFNMENVIWVPTEQFWHC